MTLPSTAVETAIAQCTSRWAMAMGHRLNNTYIVLAAVHGFSSLLRAVSAIEPSLFGLLHLHPPHPPHPPSPSPSLISHLASVDVKQNARSSQFKLATSPANMATWHAITVNTHPVYYHSVSKLRSYTHSWSNYPGHAHNVFKVPRHVQHPRNFATCLKQHSHLPNVSRATMAPSQCV